jgi:hypothetical protein
MEKRRIGVFETNSSSTHSIAISDKDCVLDTLSVVDGVCTIYSGEFGWEIETYYDAASKASYCLTWAKEYGDETHEDMLKRAVSTQMGGVQVEFEPSGGLYDWGYIDHQSSDVCNEAFGSDVSLRNFIFNPNSVLVTDNDNH